MKRLLLGLALLLATSFALAATNINTATKEELEALPGIGPVKAQAIIDYRVQHGGFKTLEELKDVKGIGARRFEKLKPELTLAPPGAKPAAKADAKGQAVAARTDAKPIK